MILCRLVKWSKYVRFELLTKLKKNNILLLLVVKLICLLWGHSWFYNPSLYLQAILLDYRFKFSVLQWLPLSSSFLQWVKTANQSWYEEIQKDGKNFGQNCVHFDRLQYFEFQLVLTSPSGLKMWLSVKRKCCT